MSGNRRITFFKPNSDAENMTFNQAPQFLSTTIHSMPQELYTSASAKTVQALPFIGLGILSVLALIYINRTTHWRRTQDKIYK